MSSRPEQPPGDVPYQVGARQAGLEQNREQATLPYLVGTQQLNATYTKRP